MRFMAQEIPCASLFPMKKEKMIVESNFLKVGKIVAIHGVMGEVRVQPWADDPSFLQQFKILYVGDTCWPIEVERARVHKNMTIIKFNGITDVNSGLAIRGQELSICRDDITLPEGQFFIADLFGLDAIDAATGETLGVIADVLDLPAHNVYLVRGAQREWMIPAVPAFIEETNIAGGYIKVNLIEGL